MRRQAALLLDLAARRTIGVGGCGVVDVRTRRSLANPTREGEDVLALVHRRHVNHLIAERESALALTSGGEKETDEARM
jgi:hypothetical protein